MIKKSKYYEVNILRGTIGRAFNKASEVNQSRNVIAVKGSDLEEATTYQYYIHGEVR